jgi:hypothetical protein
MLFPTSLMESLRLCSREAVEKEPIGFAPTYQVGPGPVS